MFLAVVVTILGLATSAPTPGRTFTLLKDERSKITFAPYTAQQRQDVAQSINSLISVYVHRENKISYYGKELPDIDPVSRLQELSKKVANMTDKEMHYQYASVFLSLRDFHTNYQMPSPHRCYSAVTAASFTFAQNRNWLGIEGPPKVVVRGLSISDEVLALSPESSQINIGDELLTIDGITFEEYFQKTKFLFGGANEWGGKRASLNTLGARGGSLYPMPEKDEVVYELKSFNTGKKYKVTLPWVARSSDSCQKEYREFLTTLNSNSFVEEGSIPQRKYTKAEIKRNLIQDKSIQLEDYQEMFGKRAGGEEKLVLNPTEEPIISWGIWKPESKNLGVIVLTSFTPKLGGPQALLLIRNLLLNELKDTNALVWDIRSNGGGSVPFADSIPQLFQSNIEPSNRRAVVSPANEYIFLNFTPATDAWHQAYLKVKPGDKYTPLTKLTTTEQANNLGAVYIKPVGVFNNGNCYSACDLFSASIKDNNVGTVFGEDGLTGAGGANVVEHDSFLVEANPRDFKRMPFNNMKQLPQGHQDARVAWRQTIRVKGKSGVLIEDNGVAADVRVLPTELDLIPNTEQNSQFDRIADVLNRKALTSGRKFMYFQALPTLDTELAIGTAFEIRLDIQGLKRIQVLDESNTEVGLLDVPLASLLSRQQRSIRFLPAVTRPSSERYEIKAFDVFGNQILTTYRFVSFTLGPEHFAPVPSVPTQLYGNETYSGLIERGTSSRGWQIQNSIFVIPPNHDPDVDSNLLFFFKGSSKPVTVTLKGTCATELDFDYLQLSFKDSKGLNDIERFSGPVTIDNTFTFTPEGDFQFILQFFSDGVTSEGGITLDLVTISA